MNSSTPTVPVLALICALTTGCVTEVGSTDFGTGGTPGSGATGSGAQGSGGDLGLTGGASSGGAGFATGGGANTGGVGVGTGGLGVATGGSAAGGFSSGGAGGGGDLPSVGGSFGIGGAGTGGQGGAGTGGQGGAGTGGDGSGGAMALTVEEFFADACSECHGPTGDGLAGKGPDIKHPVDDYSTFVIRNGRGPAEDISGKFSEYYEKAMPVFAAVLMPDPMVADCLDFLAAQPQPTTGEGLYQDYCAACHGDDARGGMTTRSLKNESGKVMQMVRSGKSLGQFGQRRDYMPKWTTAELSDAEVQLIISYLNTLP